MKKITMVSVGGNRAVCPYCKKSFKLQNKYFLPRHGFRFERGADYPQHERGNTQYGGCNGSGLEAPRDIVEEKITAANMA